MAKAKTPAVSFEDLLAFIQGKEDISTRITAVTSTDSAAPEVIRLAYSIPFVTAGEQDGFTDQNGVFVAYA
jgi:hypothetical protein